MDRWSPQTPSARSTGKTLQYADGAVRHTCPIESVANIFNGALPGNACKNFDSQSGLWMSNGDIMEANVKEFRGGQVAVESVLLGPQRVDFSNVAAVVLRPAVIEHGSFSIYCNDQLNLPMQASDVATGSSPRMRVAGDDRDQAADLLGVIADAP